MYCCDLGNPPRHKAKSRVPMWQGWEPLDSPFEKKHFLQKPKIPSARSSARLCLPLLGGSGNPIKLEVKEIYHPGRNYYK